MTQKTLYDYFQYEPTPNKTNSTHVDMDLYNDECIGNTFSTRVMAALQDYKNGLHNSSILGKKEPVMNCHEAQFRQIILKRNFVEIAPTSLHKKEKEKAVLEFIRTRQECDLIGFIHEPNGSQQFPDFRLYSIGKGRCTASLDIEMKGKLEKPKIMMNDGWFFQDAIYIITSLQKKNVLYDV